MKNAFFKHILMSLSLCTFIQASVGVSPYTQFIKEAECGGSNHTCSPNWCARVSNAGCSDPLNGNVIDVSNVPKLDCKVCTQASLAKCSTSFLNSVTIKSEHFVMFNTVQNSSLSCSFRRRVLGSLLQRRVSSDCLHWQGQPP